MDHEFCPDCGHLLSRMATNCRFCGWSDRVDHFAYRGFETGGDSDLVFGHVDAVYAEQALR